MKRTDLKIKGLQTLLQIIYSLLFYISLKDLYLVIFIIKIITN